MVAYLGVLCLVAALCSHLLPAYRLAPGFAALGLMAINALAAVGVLHLHLGWEPVRVILASMAARLLALGALLAVAAAVFHPERAQALSFVFSAMAAYVAFQILEIRHVSRWWAVRQ